MEEKKGWASMRKKDHWKVRELNDRLMMAERAFTDRDGLSGRPWYKHLVGFPFKQLVNSYVIFSCLFYFVSVMPRRSQYYPKSKYKCIQFKYYFAFSRFMRHQSTTIMDLHTSLGLLMQLKRLRVLTQQSHGILYNTNFGESQELSHMHHQSSMEN